MKTTLAILSTLSAAAVAEDIVVFGDSWGDCPGSRDAFQDMVEEHGKTVRNVAEGGTKTSDWAQFGNRNRLRDIVSETGADYVWLTIGGNDFLEAGRPFDDILPGMLNNTQAFLDPLFSRHPNTKVVQMGYDILAWNQSVNCRLWATQLFPDCSAGDTECQNYEFFQLHDKYVRRLSQMYPNHITLEIVGALQNRAGSPDFTSFAPANLVMDDCIHLEDEGYRVVSGAMYDNYFAGEGW
jgi:lysophospholipase L1-like esterase